jgi:hypothetical protein
MEEHAAGPTNIEPIDVYSVVRGIRRRAAFARLSALSVIAILTTIGIGTAFVFVQGEVSAPLIEVGPASNLQGAAFQNIGGLEWIQVLTKAFVRIGGVIMAVFIINILVSFARYNLRVSNYLDSRADCLSLTNGNLDQFAALLASISVDLLDFTKVPMSPYDTYLNAIRGVLPGRSATRETGSSKTSES